MRPILLALIHIAVGSMIQPSATRSRDKRIRVHKLCPPGVSSVKLKAKYDLSYGVPTSGIRKRIEQLENKSVVGKLLTLSSLMKNPRLARLYPTTDFSTPFVDVRLFSLLVRIAVNRRNIDESSITTACDIIQFLEEKFPQVDFDYLTPQYVLDAYNILGQRSVTLSGNSDIIFGHLNTSKPSLLRIRASVWHEHILEHRFNRLLLTGYEEIQLN